MNDEQELLASGYLDDALTDEERARAEADPAVMAAVAQLAELRRQLSVVERPDPARRDAAIKAALDVFSADRPAAAPPPVTSLSARRWSRWLMPAAAAALVAIVAGGIVATRGGQGDDDDAGGDAASVLDTDQAGAAAETDGDLLDDASAEAPAATEAPTARASQEAAATTQPAATAAAGTVPGTLSGTEDTGAYSPDALTVITSRQQLTQLATSNQALFTTPPCNAGTWLGRYLLRTDGRDTVVDVFLAERAGRVRALDPKSCEVLLVAPAPER
jgi:hypothetical protein